MYQWRKFQFFEEKGSSSAAEELRAEITCSSSGRGQMAVGHTDGLVHLLDRSLKVTLSFLAHSTSVFYIQQLKQRNILVTVGEDETVPLSTVNLKIFDLDKVQSEGTSTAAPLCLRTCQVFKDKFPEAKITSFLVFEEVPPMLLVCIGLETGVVYCLKGEIARGGMTYLKLVASAFENKSASSAITGLGLRVDGQARQLFVVTKDLICLFDIHQQTPQKITLDQVGCDGGCVATNDNQDLVIGLPEAVYFYDADGRGPCWAFEGEKSFVGWFRGYLLVVIADQRRTDKNLFNIYDLKNKLIAYSFPIGKVAQVLCEWGNIIILTDDHKVVCLGEKDMESKLEMLFRKSLYTVAINLVQSQQDAAATAEVLRKYGDHLYGKQDYDEAMAQYIRTIGQLEPSYVIQKFLDAQRIHNLTNYLEKLHEKGLATPDHTTLLINCFTKLKAVTKLDDFIKGEEGVEGDLRFDVETAVKVCRAAGYHQHAMYVAKRAGEHEWYLKILLEDLGGYDEALQYISSLSLYEAAVRLKQYGKILVCHKPPETIDVLMGICVGDSRGSIHNLHSNGLPAILPSPVDFIHISVDQPKCLMFFLEQYIIKVKDSLAHTEIHNTLLELYLSEDFCAPGFSQPLEKEEGSNSVLNRAKSLNVKMTTKGELSPLDHSASRRASKGKPDVSIVDSDRESKEEKVEQLRKGLALLKSAWPSHEQQPRYDEDLAVVLCEMHGFRDGLLFLYEKMKLYKELMGCYMQDKDYQGLIACCKRLADPSRGGDSSLWADILQYFGERGEDCSKEVKEVLVYVEKDNLLPPLIVLQTLAKNPNLTLSVVKDYVARQFQQMSQLIEEDQKTIDKYQKETMSMRKEVQDLKSNARIFQLSKCSACTSSLDLPAVHFLCMHSFHQRCLGDNEKECPVCIPNNRQLLDMKRNLDQSANDHDRFFQLLRNSDDGFSVIAEYFGRGMLNRRQ
ncbi:hypothetical protein L7F22_036915 [Adiantum nelumboides]|nr:hypothetical protein [Adiantum nelumboides]